MNKKKDGFAAVACTVHPHFGADGGRPRRIGGGRALGHHFQRTVGPRVRWLAVVALAAGWAEAAQAQRADDNATTQAEDAFGSSIGNESVGLYNPYDARGFSPVDAGNVRIEGLYFDQQDELTSRLVERSRVRVGLTTLGSLFPAPTGIADFSLRKANGKRVISAEIGGGQFLGPHIEIDAKFPLMGERLGLAAGVARRHEEYFDGADGDSASAGFTLRYAPRDGVELVPFFGRVEYWNEESDPLVITNGADIPPRMRRRSFYSQEWADNKGHSQAQGLIGKFAFGPWRLESGVFQSRLVSERSFTELFVDVDQRGAANRLIVARPGETFSSTSGEVRLAREFLEGARKHVLYAALRGRDVQTRSGGADVVPLGPGTIGVASPAPQPPFQFRPQHRDDVSQKTAGVAYQGIWAGVGELNAGLQRTDYRKINEQTSPLPTRSVRRDEPWLWNAAAAAFITKSLAVYGGYTRGLEESGSAPPEAANRFAVLPAIRTRQVEAGLRIGLAEDLKLVAGLFDVRKPYFALDLQRVYRELGDVRHRGLEASLTGEVADGLTLVFGMVLMRPRVTGEPVTRGEIGPKPVGQTPRTIRASLDYKVPFLDGWSLDCLFQNIGERIGSVDNMAIVPGRSVLDIGARYAFAVADNPTTLRVRVGNVTNKFGYRVLGDHAFGANNPRQLQIFLTTDL